MNNTISSKVTILKNSSELEEEVLGLRYKKEEIDAQFNDLISQLKEKAQQMGVPNLSVSEIADGVHAYDVILWEIISLMKNRKCYSYYDSIFALIDKFFELQPEYELKQNYIQHFIKCFEYNLYLTTHPSDTTGYAMHPIYVVQAIKILHTLLARVEGLSGIQNNILTQQVQLLINGTFKKIVHERSFLKVYVKGVNNYIERIGMLQPNIKIINTQEVTDSLQQGVNNWETGDILLLYTKICTAAAIQWADDEDLIDYKRYLIHVLQETIGIFENDIKNNELRDSIGDKVFFFKGLATLSFDETIGAPYQKVVLNLMRQFFPEKIMLKENKAYRTCIDVCQNILIKSKLVTVKLCAAKTLEAICPAWEPEELNIDEVILAMQVAVTGDKYLSVKRSIIEVALNIAKQYGPDRISKSVCEELIHCVHVLYPQFPRDINNVVDQLMSKFSITSGNPFLTLSFFWGKFNAVVFPLIMLDAYDENNTDTFAQLDTVPLMSKKDR